MTAGPCSTFHTRVKQHYAAVPVKGCQEQMVLLIIVSDATLMSEN